MSNARDKLAMVLKELHTGNGAQIASAVEQIVADRMLDLLGEVDRLRDLVSNLVREVGELRAVKSGAGSEKKAHA